MASKKALEELYKEREYLLGDKVNHKSNENWNNDIKHYDNIGHNLIIIEKDLEALVVLKDLFDFDFALRFPSNQPMLRIENKRTNEYWEIPIAQEKYDLLKEVFK